MHSTRRTQAGLSLVEPLVTATIASVLALASLPGLEQARERHRLDSAVHQLESELQFARSTAVARGETVRALFRSGGAGSCYVIHTGGPGDCRCDTDGTAWCPAEVEILRSAAFTPNSGLRLSASAREVGFGAELGTVTPGVSLQMENRAGQRVRLVVSIMGRIRSCAAGAAFAGLPLC